MLHEYPPEVRFHSFSQLEALQKKLPQTPEEILESLNLLLPLLGDELVPVWQSAPLPSHPVALVSFRDKANHSLVAVVCESGLLWVAPAAHPESAATLQLPKIGLESMRVHGLLASQALRPFGGWTELLVPVKPVAPAEAPTSQVYRALVQSDGLQVTLEPAIEDTAQETRALIAPEATEWLPLPLPPEKFGHLVAGNLIFSVGVDPFSTPGDDLPNAKDSLVLLGKGQAKVAVKGRMQLSLHGENHDLLHPLTTGIAFRFRNRLCVVVGEEGRQLEGLSVDVDRPSPVEHWQQLLQFHPVAVDWIDDDGPPDKCWPDLLLVFDDRRVARLARVGAERLQQLWNSLIGKLGIKEDLQAPDSWAKWCLDRIPPHQDDKPTRASLRRTLQYLATDRAMTGKPAGASEDLRESLAGLVKKEFEPPLLVPAARRLKESLSEWERETGKSGSGVPDLVWSWYEKAPFAIQELFDSHMRLSTLEKERTNRLREISSKGYGRLHEQAPAVTSTYVDEKDPVRNVGIHVMRAMDTYSTAYISAPVPNFRFRQLVAIELDDETYLAAIGYHEIRLYRVTESEGQIELEPDSQKVTQLDPLFTSQFAILTQAGGQPRLLLGSLQGELASWDPVRAGKSEALHRTSMGGSLSAATPYLPQDQSTLPGVVIVAQNELDMTRLLQVRIKPSGELELKAKHEVGPGRVQSLLSCRVNGAPFLLLGDGEDLLPLIDGFAPSKEPPFKAWVRYPLGSTVTAIRLSDASESTPQITACTREGHMFTMKPEGQMQPWERFEWLFQVPRGVASIIPSDRQSLIGVVSTQGQVTLLDQDGERIFEEHSLDAVEAGLLFVAKGQRFLAVGTHSGGIRILQEIPDRQKALRIAEDKLKLVEPEVITEEPPQNEATEMGWMLARLLERDNLGKPGDPIELYHRIKFPRTKSALARWVAREPERVHKPDDFVDKLTLRDLATFLQFLPTDSSPQWTLLGWQRVCRETKHSLDDTGLVLYELLRLSHRQKRRLTSENLRALPATAFESSWVSLLVALELVESLGPRARTMGRLLAPLLGALARFPLQVARAATIVTGASKEIRRLQKVLHAWVLLGEATVRRAHPHEIQTAVWRLAAGLEEWQGEDGSGGLLARLVRLIATPLPRGDEAAAWLQLLEALREAEKVREDSPLQPYFFSPIASWLPAGFPGTDAHLAEEEAWLLAVQERTTLLPRLEEEQDQARTNLTETDRVWQAVYQQLLSRGLSRFHILSERAVGALRSKVRLHLRARGVRYLPQQHVELELEAQIEALKRAKDIRFKIDLGQQDGLESTGKELEQEGEVLELDPRKSPSAITFVMTGRLAPGQQQVKAAVALSWGERSHRSFSISIALPARPVSTPGGRAPFPEALASRSHELVEQLQEVRQGTLMVLLDEDLGRAGLAVRLGGPGARGVDLDVALRDIGPGRAYPALLTVETITAALRGEAVPVRKEAGKLARGFGPGDQIVISACDDLWERLLANPALARVREEFLDLLESHRKRPGLLLFVNSRIGMVLRRRRRLPWLLAYRLGIADQPDEATAEEAALREAGDWVTAEAAVVASDKLGKIALKRLGGDLRLGMRLRPTWRNQALNPGELTENLTTFLETPACLEILHGDLVGLPPQAIHMLLVATCSQTVFRFKDVEVGLVAAESLRATGPGNRSGKTITSQGQRIDPHAIVGLRSDRQSRDRTLKVEGYSATRPVEIAAGARHLVLFLGDGTQIARMAEQLAEIGAVETTEEVIRVLPPYGELIRMVLQRRQNPTEVYKTLSGGSSPLAFWPLSLFASVSSETLAEVDPNLESKQTTMLQQLGTAWHTLAQGKRLSEQQLLLRELRTLSDQKVNWQAGAGRSSATFPYLSAERPDFLLGMGKVDWRGLHPYYWLFLARPETGKREPKPPTALLRALAQGPDKPLAAGQDQRPSKPSLLLVVRAGDRPIRTDEEQWIEIADDDLRTAAINNDWTRAFWGLVRARAGLRTLAPFKSEGALPPGSPSFAGRDLELQYMLRHVSQQSFLIVGSRQVGKTSLLNAFWHKLQEKRSDLASYYFDLQGFKTAGELEGKMFGSMQADAEAKRLTGRRLISHLIESANDQQKHPVFLLNEIDAMLAADRDFLAFLRGCHDQSRAHFVMTGYTHAAAACDDAESPFYHWTTATEGQKYFVLAALKRRAVERIVKVLEEPPLQLTWINDQDRKQALNRIVDRSYRIPHLVQALCLGLVERLEEKKEYRLSLADLEAVLAQSDLSAWSYLQKIDLCYAAPRLEPELARTFVRLVLHVAMNQLYFKGGRPRIYDPYLSSMGAASLSFTPDDIRNWLPKSLEGLLVAKEFQEAYRMINGVDLKHVLSALSLTLALAYDPKNDRYYFPNHIYPRELLLQLRPGEQIEDRILELVLRFAYFLSTTSQPKPYLEIAR